MIYASFIYNKFIIIDIWNDLRFTFTYFLSNNPILSYILFEFYKSIHSKGKSTVQVELCELHQGSSFDRSYSTIHLLTDEFVTLLPEVVYGLHWDATSHNFVITLCDYAKPYLDILIFHVFAPVLDLFRGAIVAGLPMKAH